MSDMIQHELVRRSECIGDLATALSKVQAVIQHAPKSATNPHYKSSYATLADIWDACRKPLTDNGFSVVQCPASADGQVLQLTTLLLHSSGQWIAHDLAVRPTKADAQGIGSAITYARRYSLAAVVGVAAEDDDGNAASQPQRNGKADKRPPPPKPAVERTPMEKAKFALRDAVDEWTGAGKDAAAKACRTVIERRGCNAETATLDEIDETIAWVRDCIEGGTPYAEAMKKTETTA